MNDVMLKRARHVITEIQRTTEAASSLEKNDFIKFGQLMNESHNSLRDDYEVSSKELDILVSIARGVNGVLGSRLTGAGFGGCTVTLLRQDAVQEVIHLIKEKLAWCKVLMAVLKITEWFSNNNNNHSEIYYYYSLKIKFMYVSWECY